MVLMVHNSINKKNVSNLKYPKYGDFTLYVFIFVQICSLTLTLNTSPQKEHLKGLW
jgi:hypothetical protein